MRQTIVSTARAAYLFLITAIIEISAAILPHDAVAGANWKLAHFYTTSASERDNAVSVFGYENEGICCWVADVPSASDPTPLYRLLGSQHGDHLLTTSVAEADAAVTQAHYTQEDNCCYVFSTPVPGSTALYRLRGTKSGDRFYTVSAQERDAAIATGNYVSEGMCCYLPASSAQTAVPLYRLYNAKKQLHFYTQSAAERDNAVARYGYTEEGTCCSVIARAPSVMPLYRMRQPDSLDHFYTVSVTERGNALQHGYLPEGICCYVAAAPSGGTPLFRLYDPAHNAHFYTIDATERDNAMKNLGFLAEDICCAVMAASAPHTVPLYRTALAQCQNEDESVWQKIKDFIDATVPVSCPMPPPPPPPPTVTFNAAPNNGYNCLGVIDTLSWKVTDCGSSCEITLNGSGTGYASNSPPVQLANLPLTGGYSLAPADIWNFTLAATSPNGTTTKKAQLAISPPNTCGAAGQSVSLMPFYFAVEASNDLVPQCAWVELPADNQSDAQKALSASYGSAYTITSISEDDFDHHRQCP